MMKSVGCGLTTIFIYWSALMGLKRCTIDTELTVLIWGSFDKIALNLKRLHDMSPDYYRTNVRFSVVLSPPYDFKNLNDFFTHEPLADVRSMRASGVDTPRHYFFLTILQIMNWKIKEWLN